jgi:hypothetical protein
LVGKPRREKQLGIPRHRLEFNIEGCQMNFWESVQYVFLVQDWEHWWSLITTVIKYWVT